MNGKTLDFVFGMCVCTAIILQSVWLGKIQRQLNDIQAAVAVVSLIELNRK